MKGSYLLVFSLPTAATIQVGKLGNVSFNKGWYVYVGSAMNGVEQRVQRHLRTQKKTHWHIDYLLPFVDHIDVFYQESNVKKECTIAQALSATLQEVPFFGCSDCSCPSHLFLGSKDTILSCVNQLDMNPYPCDANA